MSDVYFLTVFEVLLWGHMNNSVFIQLRIKYLLLLSSPSLFILQSQALSFISLFFCTCLFNYLSTAHCSFRDHLLSILIKQDCHCSWEEGMWVFTLVYSVYFEAASNWSMPNTACVVSSDSAHRGSLDEFSSDVRLNEVTVCHTRDNLRWNRVSGTAFTASFLQPFILKGGPFSKKYILPLSIHHYAKVFCCHSFCYILLPRSKFF